VVVRNQFGSWLVVTGQATRLLVPSAKRHCPPNTVPTSTSSPRPECQPEPPGNV
jgi:hypothetical protein